MTLDILFNKCEKIKPRLYTIASSAKMHPQDLHIAVSLSADKLPNGKTKMGVTSAFLDLSRKTGQMATARIFTRDSSFIMPKDPKIPFIMCGPGTGVVPFLGFIQERSLMKKEDLSEATLYFGCRERNSDFIYRDEMATAKDNKIISELYICLSREPNEPKTYVQQELQKHKDHLENLLLKQGGYFFICGSTSMGRDVNAVLKSVCGDEEYEKLRKDGKLIQELW
jgi:NADPH-ferrihemoprotein reductase